MSYKSDTGPFAIVPNWVLDLPISDRSVRLYGVLARYADNDTGECTPSRRTLWERIGCSERSLDAAVAELEAHRALSHKRRKSGDAWLSNEWTIHRIPPEGVGQASAPPGARNDIGGGAGNAALTRPTDELEEDSILYERLAILDEPKIAEDSHRGAMALARAGLVKPPTE